MESVGENQRKEAPNGEAQPENDSWVTKKPSDFAGIKPQKNPRQNSSWFSTFASDPESKWESLSRKAKYIFPILEWLPEYRVKQSLPGDIISGLTVGVMLVPQGMVR